MHNPPVLESCESRTRRGNGQTGNGLGFHLYGVPEDGGFYVEIKVYEDFYYMVSIKNYICA